jgi:Ca2+-binding EF-hand superfamily protein
MIWLTTLPFALVRTFSEFGTDTWWDNRYQPVIVVVMSFLSIVFLSIEDISVQIEEPFCVLPLDLHQQWLKRDLGQMKKTSRLVDVMLQQSTSTRSHHDSATYDRKSTKKKRRRKRQRLALLRDRLLRQSPFHRNNHTNVLYGKHIDILDEVSEIFHTIDTNGDGVITKDELRSHLVEKMGYTAEYADYLFVSIDTDSSDDITKDEMKFAFYNFEALSMYMTFSMGGADITNSRAFQHLASKNATGGPTEKLLLDDLADLIFDIIDTDKNGIISVDELKTYFESVTSKLKSEGATKVESQTYVQTIFATFDANADGKICRDEIRAGFEKYDFKLLARSFGLRVIPHNDQAKISKHLT